MLTCIFGVAIAYSGLGLSGFQSIPYRLFVGIGTALFGVATMMPYFINATKTIHSLVIKKIIKTCLAR